MKGIGDDLQIVTTSSFFLLGGIQGFGVARGRTGVKPRWSEGDGGRASTVLSG